MELANWIFGGGAAGGFVALIYVILNFWRGTRSDAVDAYASLTAKLEKRCDDLEAQLKAEREDCDRKLEELRREVDGLRRQMAQHGISAARLLQSN